MYQYAIIAVTWFFFIVNIFVMQIVLLNFLVAEVSMTYARIKDLGPCLIYQKKQELNFFVQKIVTSYGKENFFKALIFISPKEHDDDNDELTALAESIKSTVSYELLKVKNDIYP